MKWEMVVGLETHIELSTKSKIFCSCSTQFGGEPNTHCCPVCTGQPGVLPWLNRQVVEYAVKAGLALNCSISRISKMDRKHYVYPDMTKAFQTSQYDVPLCVGGYVDLSNGRRINLTRIHIEEDAGKLIHEGGSVYIDYNRAGVPLIEIVTEPDFRSAEEAVEYLEKLQGIARTIGVSDCRMQEGSLRCDVNISVREAGSDSFGIRTEVKNLNSFSSVLTAIKYEFERQTDILESGGQVVQETLHFNPNSGETVNMRGKENADDYRYFREPDITTIVMTDEEIERIRSEIPELPDAKCARYVEQFGLTEADARLLSKYRRVSEFFEEAVEGLQNPKTAANMILTQMFSIVSTEVEREEWKVSITGRQLNELLTLMEKGKINRNIVKKVFPIMLESGRSAEEIIEQQGLGGGADIDLEALCRKIVDANPAAVADIKAGKSKALQSLVGAVMRETRGQADAKAAMDMFVKIIG